MNFSDKLDKAINRALNEQDVLGTGISQPGSYATTQPGAHANVPQDTAKSHKLVADFTRAADRASMGLSELKRVMESSGLAQNKVLMPFMEQLDMLCENLKEDGVLRKNFESVLSLPMVAKK